MSNGISIDRYIRSSRYREALGLPEEPCEEYRVLAQGEYNLNYVFTHPVTGKKMVLRVNCGSQMHLEHQIEYESNALRLIHGSGRTPAIYYTDGSAEAPGSGVLVMEYIPGKALDYEDERQLASAAECLADIHSVYIDPDITISGSPASMPTGTTSLIAPHAPMRAVLEECEQMLAVYMESDIPAEADKTRLRRLLDNAWKLIPDKEDAPYRCCINTELNSTNFLVSDREGVGCEVKLIDWEKPLYGDPAQDLGHFLAPTTTFWKTDVIFDTKTTEAFIECYLDAAGGRFNTEGVRKRTLAFIPVTCLRGMTWCAMAWVQYRQSDKSLINESTRNKLEQYLSDAFITDIEARVDAALKNK